MSTLPLISVAIALYNKAAVIEETVASVLAQSFVDFELVIVDDGSTDDSVVRVRSFDDPRLVLVGQSNTGVAAARNRALCECRATLVAFLDADDVWRPDHLQHLLELSRRFPQAALAGNRFIEFVRDGPTTGASAAVAYRLLDDYFVALAYGLQPFCASSCIVKRAEAIAVGAFPVGYSRGEDLALWIKLAARWPVAVSNYVGCGYRRGPNTLTARPISAPDISMITLEQIIAEHGEWPVVRKQAAREYYYRIALAHCLDCIRAGDLAAAERFLILSAGTNSFRRRWWEARLLASAPRSLREFAFFLSDRRKSALSSGATGA